MQCTCQAGLRQETVFLSPIFNNLGLSALGSTVLKTLVSCLSQDRDVSR